MGAQIDRLPEGAAVASTAEGGRAAVVATAEAPSFGAWYRRQRELRGISIFYVAARTKLAPERVRDIEESRAQLETDGIGRGTARSLALAIGADPDEAAAFVARERAPFARTRQANLRLRALAWTLGRRAGLLIALGVGLWLLGLWLSGAALDSGTPRLVYKTDYVEKLLRPN